MNHQVKKAVFPVAGWGTRFLPATKANPKEMLPIVDKPLIQYAVEEAVACGIKELIFVTSSNKRAIEDHFDSNYELEELLKRQKKTEWLKLVEEILPRGVHCIYVRQHKMLGLGHAVLCAKPVVGDEPFAVLLADDLIDNNKKSCLQQLVDIYQKEKGSVIAVENVKDENVNKYGIIDPNEKLNPYAKIKGIVEKPNVQEAPSRYGVVGRYVLTPKIFELLEKQKPGTSGEIQLTDAIQQLLKIESVFALIFEGRRYDCGNKLGYLEATVQYALKHPEILKDFLKILKTIK